MNKKTAQRMMDLFAGRSSAHGTHGHPVKKAGTSKWEIKSTARSLREPVTVELWEQHLAGTRPLGVIPVREDNTCLWGSIDVDEYDINLLELVQRVEANKLPLVPCRSKSGGLHLFLFLKEPMPAGALQAVLVDFAAQLGKAGSEIFPKQTQVLADRGDVGNWMVMPYYGDTYGGKLKEQVGLRKTGAELTVDEFLVLGERSRVSPDDLEEAGRRRQKAAEKSSSRRTSGGGSTTGGPFADGPPCLQHLAQQGVQPGGQSNALFHMGVYFKRAFPEDWENRLERANQELLQPPGSAEGLTSVIRSLRKKDYEYTCKNEPMVSHCNSMLCRTRRFGVGDGGNIPSITGMSKLDTEPPVWFVDVEGERVDATTEQLQNYTLFHRLCMDRLHRCYRMLTPKEWLPLVSAAMDDGLTLIEAPPDVGARGRFLELLSEFLTNRSKSQSKDDLLSGRPWEDEEAGRHYFRLRDLQTFLNRENVRDMTRPQMVQRVRDLGGGDAFFNLKGKGCQCWWVPSSALNFTPELDPPRLPVDPI